MKTRVHHALNILRTQNVAYFYNFKFCFFTLCYVTNQNVVDKDNKWLHLLIIKIVNNNCIEFSITSYIYIYICFPMNASTVLCEWNSFYDDSSSIVLFSTRYLHISHYNEWKYIKIISRYKSQYCKMFGFRYLDKFEECV